MKTISWVRTATIDGEDWEFGLAQGRLNLWRNSVIIATAYGGKSIEWAKSTWPEEIVPAWQEMLDVMQREAGQ